MSGKYMRAVLDIVLYVAGAIVLVWLTYRLFVFFLPFVLGWLIALAANPLVRFLENHLKIVRKHGSVLIIIAAIALVIGVSYGAISQIVKEVYGFMDLLPELYGSLVRDLQEIGTNLQSLGNRFSPEISEGISALITSLTDSLGDLVGTIGKPTVAVAGNVAKNIPSALIHVIFTILSAYFFIAQRERILQLLREHIPLGIREKWSFVADKFRAAVGGYFRAQFKIMGVVALILFAGFWLLHIKYAILIALLIAFLDFLPFFGTGTALLPWAVLKVLSGDYQFAVGLTIIYLVSQLVRQLIQPKIVGDTIGLDPLSTLFFMYIGYKVSSIFGMILAVPVGMILVSLYQAGAFGGLAGDFRVLADGVKQLRKGIRNDEESHGQGL